MPINQNARNRKSRVIGFAVLIVLWLMFAGWQFAEHQHQCDLIRKALSSKAETLSSAVRTSLQSHRWFGPFVQQNLPSVLSVLAATDGTLAIAVVADNAPDHPYSAGDVSQLLFDLPEGEHTRGSTEHLVSRFAMREEPPMMSPSAYGSGEPFEQTFRSFVVIDRTEAQSQMNREAGSRLLVLLLGTLLLIAVAMGWLFTIRLAEAEGTAKVLTAETRHLRELGQAAAGLAHETRNPLGLIRGWTQRLVDSGLPNASQQEQAATVLEECDRVTARINQFLAFARPADLQMEPVDLKKLLGEIETLIQSDLERRALQLRTAGLTPPDRIMADPSQLRQVLFNMLQNAIAFAPEGSEITISMHRSQSGGYRLQITDRGPGVPDELQETLFDPYVTQRPGGTGLGLSIVRRIAVAHGWEVGYQPGTDGGSVFWLAGIKAA